MRRASTTHGVFIPYCSTKRIPTWTYVIAVAWTKFRTGYHLLLHKKGLRSIRSFKIVKYRRMSKLLKNLLADYGYNVVALPKEDIKPLQLLCKDGDGVIALDA